MELAVKSATKSALDAKYEAQKIAFAPVVFQVARSLRDLGILEIVQESRKNGITAENVASQLNLSVYGVKTLLELGETIDLVSSSNDHFVITKTGYFIQNDNMTRVNMDFIHDVCYNGLFTLDQAISEGKPTGLKVFGQWKTIYEALSQLPEKVKKSWFAFDHYYSDVAFPEVLPIVFKHKPKRLFDVGGNTGKWALSCVRYDEDVTITILDLPGQLNVALNNAREAGFEDRIEGHEIDLLNGSKAFPENPDAIWMSQFLDCFSQEEIVSILKRAAASMSDDTNLYILETYWNRQRFEASKFSLQATSVYFTSMANGNSKMYHSNEMYDCIQKAGLKVVEDIDNIGVSHTLLRLQKAS